MPASDYQKSLDAQYEDDLRESQRQLAEAEREATRQQKEQAQQQKEAAKEQQRVANNKKEATFRAQKRPQYVDAYGDIQPTHTDEEWQQQQETARTNAAAHDEAVRSGRKFTTSKVTGAPIYQESEQDLAAKQQAQAEKDRKAHFDAQIRAVSSEYGATVAQNIAQGLKPLTAAQRKNLEGDPLDKEKPGILKETRQEALNALQSHYQQQAGATDKAGWWDVVNNNPTPEAAAAQQHLSRLTAPEADLTEEDLTTLSQNEATKPLVAKLQNMQGILSKDDEFRAARAAHALRIADLKLRRDAPEKWAETVRARRASMSPEELQKDLEASGADLDTRTATLEQQATTLNEQVAQHTQQLDSLAQQAAERRQQGIPAGEVVTLQHEDGSVEHWPQDLAAQRESVVARLQDTQAQQAPDWAAIKLQQRELQQETALHNESAQLLQTTQKAKAEEAKQSDLSHLKFTPGHEQTAQEIEALDSEAQNRLADLNATWEGNPPPEAVQAIQKDIAQRSQAALAMGDSRRLAAQSAYAGIQQQVQEYQNDPQKKGDVGDLWINARKNLAEALNIPEAKAMQMLEDAEAETDWDKVLGRFQEQTPSGEWKSWRNALSDDSDPRQTRVLSNGGIVVNPSITDEAKYKAAVEAAKASPEAKAAALARYPQIRQRQGQNVLDTLKEIEGTFGKETLKDWQDYAKQRPKDVSEQDWALKFSEKLKADTAASPWTSLLKQVMRSGAQGLYDLRQQGSGFIAGLTGSEAAMQDAQWAGRKAEALGATKELEGTVGHNFLSRGVLDQLPRLAGSILPAAGAAKAAQLGIRLFAATSLGARLLPSLAASMESAATPAQAVKAVQTLTRVGLGGTAAAAGIQTYGSQLADIYGTLRRENPSLTHQQALSAAQQPAILSAAVGALLTTAGGAHGIEKLLVNPAAARELFKKQFTSQLQRAGFLGASFAKGAGKQLLEELPDELFSQYQSAVASHPGDAQAGTKAIAQFMQQLPELSVAIGLLGGGGEAISDAQGTSIQHPASSHPASLPETQAAAEAAIQNHRHLDANGVEIPEFTAATQQRAALALATARGGDLFDATEKQLNAAGWTRRDSQGRDMPPGKYARLKDYTGPNVLNIDTAGRAHIDPQYLTSLKETLPAVAAAIPDESTRPSPISDLPSPQSGNPAEGQTPAHGAGANANQNPVSAPDQSGSQPPPSGTPPAQSGSEVVSSESGNPEIPVNPVNPVKSQDSTRVPTVEKSIADWLVDRHMPDAEAAAAAKAITSHPDMAGKDYDHFTRQITARDQVLQSLGITGSTSKKQAATNPLRFPHNGTVAHTSGSDSGPSENSDNSVNPVQNSGSSSSKPTLPASVQSALDDTIPGTPSPEVFDAIKKAVQAKEMTEQQAAEIVAQQSGAQDHTALRQSLENNLGWNPTRANTAAALHFGDKTKSDIPLASADRASNRVPSGSGSGNPASSIKNPALGPEPELAAAPSTLTQNDDYARTKLAALSRIKDPTQKAWARQLFALIEKTFEKHHLLYDAIATGAVARKHLGGQFTAVMVIDGKVTRLIDLDAMVAQFSHIENPAAALRATGIEEDVHALVLQLSRKNPEKYGYPALVKKWRALPDKLKQAVWQSYNNAAQGAGLAKSLPIPDLSASQEWHMMNEFLRMLVQDAHFAGQITETVDAAPGLIQWVKDLLADLGQILRNLLKAAPPALQKDINSMVAEIGQQLSTIESRSTSTTSRLESLTSLRDPAAAARQTLAALGSTTPIFSRAALERIFNQMPAALQKQTFHQWQQSQPAETPAKASKADLMRFLLGQMLADPSLATSTLLLAENPATTLLAKLFTKLSALTAASPAAATYPLRSLHVATLRALGGLHGMAFVQRLSPAQQQLYTAALTPAPAADPETPTAPTGRAADMLAALEALEQDHQQASTPAAALRLREKLRQQEIAQNRALFFAQDNAARALLEPEAPPDRGADMLAALQAHEDALALDHQQASTPVAAALLRTKLGLQRVARNRSRFFLRDKAARELHAAEQAGRQDLPKAQSLLALATGLIGTRRAAGGWRTLGIAERRQLARLGIGVDQHPSTDAGGYPYSLSRIESAEARVEFSLAGTQENQMAQEELDWMRQQPAEYQTALDPLSPAYVERDYVIIKQSALDDLSLSYPHTAALIRPEWHTRQSYGLRVDARSAQAKQALPPASPEERPTNTQQPELPTTAPSPASGNPVNSVNPVQTPSLVPAKPAKLPTFDVPVKGEGTITATFPDTASREAFQFKHDLARSRKLPSGSERTKLETSLSALKARFMADLGLGDDAVTTKLAAYHEHVVAAAAEHAAKNRIGGITAPQFEAFSGGRSAPSTKSLPAPVGGDLIADLARYGIGRISSTVQPGKAGDMDWFKSVTDGTAGPHKQTALILAVKAADAGELTTPLARRIWLAGTAGLGLTPAQARWERPGHVLAPNGMAIDAAASTLSSQQADGSGTPYQFESGDALGLAILEALDSRIAAKGQAADPTLAAESDAQEQSRNFDTLISGNQDTGQSMTGAEIAAQLDPDSSAENTLKLGTAWFTVDSQDDTGLHLTASGPDADLYGQQTLAPDQNYPVTQINDRSLSDTPATRSNNAEQVAKYKASIAELIAAVTEDASLGAADRLTAAQVREMAHKKVAPPLTRNFKGGKAWLFPDGQFAPVDEHYELMPEGPDGNLLQGWHLQEAGIVRIEVDREDGYIYADYTRPLTNQQRQAVRDTAAERRLKYQFINTSRFIPEGEGLAASNRTRLAAASFVEDAIDTHGLRTFADLLRQAAQDLPAAVFTKLRSPHFRAAWNWVMAERGLPEVSREEEQAALRTSGPKIERRYNEPDPETLRRAANATDDMAWSNPAPEPAYTPSPRTGQLRPPFQPDQTATPPTAGAPAKNKPAAPAAPAQLDIFGASHQDYRDETRLTPDGSPVTRNGIKEIAPYLISGNKGDLVGLHGNFFLQLARDSNGVLDAFGGAAIYTHFLAQQNALTPGSIWNEWEYSRAITNGQIRNNPAAVVREVLALRSDFLQTFPRQSPPADYAAMLTMRASILAWVNQRLESTFPARSLDEMGRYPLPDTAQTAALYLFIQNHMAENRVVDFDLSPEGLPRCFTGGKMNGKDDLRFVVAPKDNNNAPEWVVPFRIWDDSMPQQIKTAKERLQQTTVRHGDGWQLAADAPTGSLAFVDTSYFPSDDAIADGDEVMNYGRTTMGDAHPDNWFIKFKKYLLPKSDSVRYVITNNFNSDVVEKLEQSGWTVLRTYRGNTDAPKHEFIALSPAAAAAVHLPAAPERRYAPGGLPRPNSGFVPAYNRGAESLRRGLPAGEPVQTGERDPESSLSRTTGPRGSSTPGIDHTLEGGPDWDATTSAQVSYDLDQDLRDARNFENDLYASAPQIDDADLEDELGASADRYRPEEGDEDSPALPAAQRVLPPKPDLDNYPTFKGTKEERRAQWDKWHRDVDTWRKSVNQFADRQGNLGTFLAAETTNNRGGVYREARVITRIPGSPTDWRTTIFGQQRTTASSAPVGDWANNAWVPIAHDEFPTKGEAYQSAVAAMPESYTFSNKALFAAPRTVEHVEPGFYSALAEAIRAKMPARSTPATVVGILKNAGIKTEELKWTGILPWLQQQAQDGPITQQQVLDYLKNEGSVNFYVTRLSSSPSPAATAERAQIYARFTDITDEMARMRIDHEEGTITQEDYRSRYKLLSQTRESLKEKLGLLDAKAKSSNTRNTRWTLAGGTNHTEVVISQAENEADWKIITDTAGTEDLIKLKQREEAKKRIENRPSYPFQSSDTTHYSDLRALAWYRAAEHGDGLLVDEFQSKYHQEGREKGYRGDRRYTVTADEAMPGMWVVKDPNGNTVNFGTSEAEAQRWADSYAADIGGVPDAPYRTTWPLMLFKRALQDAVTTGKAWIGWTNGDTQADRYDLSKQIDKIAWSKPDKLNPGYTFSAWKDDKRVIQKNDVPEQQLSAELGKEIAKKIIEDPNKTGTIEEQGLKVGGEGMRGFYDNILPKEIGKYVKQWGAGVAKGRIPSISDQYAGTPYASAIDQPGPEIWRIDITPQMKAGVEAGQALFAAPRRAYESMSFDPPFHTPFGDILSYDWMNQPVGGLSSQRTSDWSRARTNPATGRDIVHHFKVQKPDGIHTVSLETALGQLTEPQRHKLQSLIKSEQRRREEAAAGQMTLFAGQRVTPEQDAEYMAAVESGDVAKQQAMVDAAAKAAGFTEKLWQGVWGGKLIGNAYNPKYIGKRNASPLSQIGYMFSTSRVEAQRYGVPTRFFIKPANLKDQGKKLDWWPAQEAVKDGAGMLVWRGVTDASDDVSDIFLVSPGNESNIKSADPITRDAEGNVIPLSQRFNPDSNSILYAAQRVEAAAAETDRNPSDAQKAAGNYTKGKVTLHGLRLSIENPRGSVRSGKDATGKAWSVTMPHHYGYFLGTEGKDGDHVDFFLGPNPESQQVLIVNQRKVSNGHFDEHKVMLGFDSPAQAAKAYLAAYTPGWKGLQSAIPTTIPVLKEWLQNHDTTKPVTREGIAKIAQSLPSGSDSDIPLRLHSLAENSGNESPLLPASPRVEQAAKALDKTVTGLGNAANLIPKAVGKTLAAVTGTGQYLPGNQQLASLGTTLGRADAAAAAKVGTTVADALQRVSGKDIRKAPDAVAAWLGKPDGLGAWTKSVVVDQLLPTALMPREWLALSHEMQRKTAFGAEKSNDLIRALSGNPRLSDLAYPKEFAENMMYREQLFDAMEGKIPMSSLPPAMQALGTKLRAMLRDTGLELVKQGVMHPDTFEELQSNGWMPRYMLEEAMESGGSVLAAFKLGVKDLLQQRSTAFHIVDTTRKGKDGQYLTVNRQEKGRNAWRFRDAATRDAFYSDFIRRQALDMLQETHGNTKEVQTMMATLDGQQRREIRAQIKLLTRADMDSTQKLSPALAGMVKAAIEHQKAIYKKENPFDPPKLIKDPVYAIARYILAQTHNAATMELLNETAKNKDWTSDVSLQGFTEIPDNDRFGPLAGKFVQKDIAQQILDKLDVPNAALRFYDGILRKWKSGKLVWNPGSHIRDAVGNTVFAYLGGSSIANPGNWPYYRQAIEIMRNGGPLYAELLEHGVLGGDAYSSLVRERLKGLLPDAKTVENFNPGLIQRTFFDFGSKFHATHEQLAEYRRMPDDFYKIAAYLKAKAEYSIQHPASSIEDRGKAAAAHVRKWFPYYDRLGGSATTRAAGRFVNPFLSFFRESTRILATAAVERPIALAAALAFPAAISALSAMLLGLDDRDKDEIGKDLAGRGKGILGLSSLHLFSMLLPVRSSQGQVQQFDISAIMPFADLLGQKIVPLEEKENAWQTFWRQTAAAGPIGNLGVSWITNRDLFSGRHLTEADMSTPEMLKAYTQHAANVALPPLAPDLAALVGIGDGGALSRAGTRQTNKTLQTYDTTQTVIRSIFGMNVKSAAPNIYRQADDFRKTHGYDAQPDFDYGTTATSRAKRALVQQLAQDQPNPTAIKNLVKRLKDMGVPLDTPGAITKVLKIIDPASIIGGSRKQNLTAEDARQRFRQSLPPESRALYEASLQEYRKIQQRAPLLLRAAQ